MLKPDRRVLETDITLACNDVCEQGSILMYGTSGSGAAIGDLSGTCTLASNPSGKIPAGVTLADFVNIDQSLYHRNWHKVQQVVGEKAPLMTKGWVTSNLIIGTPAVGNTAYVSSSGNVTPTLHATGGTVATPKVGQFQSIVDEDGYAKVYVDLPVV